MLFKYEEALEKLDIGYIDFMLLHHPGAGDVETYKIMEQYVADGKIKSIGLSNWADAHGVSSAQVILRWEIQNGVIVMPGSSNPEHIKENLDIFGFELTDDEMEQMKALNRDEKHDWY